MPVQETQGYIDSKLKEDPPFFDHWGYRVASVQNMTTYDARTMNKDELKPPMTFRAFINGSYPL